MTRRFAATVLTAVLAMASVPANAMAPTITPPLSPVITDDAPNSASNYFVYVDALNLDTMGSDDTLASNQIIWSYAGSGAGGASRYRINLKTPMDLGGGDNPNNPGAKSLGAGADDTVGNGITQDANLRTLTFRDFTYSADTTIPDGEGADTNETITLFASDGSAFSQRSMIVYTDGAALDNGGDRLSGATAPSGPSIFTGNQAFTGTFTWTSSSFFDPFTLTSGATGLCFQTAGAPGPSGIGYFGGWTSPYGIVDLQANSLYRFRLQIDNNTGANQAAGTTPVWGFGVDNFDPAREFQANKYFGDHLNIDNFQAVNLTGTSAPAGVNPNSAGVSTANIRTFDIYYCVPPVSAADWNDPTTGFHVAANDTLADMRFLFRVFDISTAANNANLDAGTLCLRTLTIDRIPMSSVQVLSTPYDAQTLTGTGTGVGRMHATTIFGLTPAANARTTVTFAGGDMTITPSAGPFNDGTTAATAWGLEVITVGPGTGDVADTLLNWPVPWVSGQLLRGIVGVQAPNAQAALNPPDAIQLSFDSPTTELLQTSAVAATTSTLGMPKTTPSDLTAFFYTQTTTNSDFADGGNLRMRVQLLNTPNILSGGLANNIGGTTLTKLRIDNVQVPN